MLSALQDGSLPLVLLPYVNSSAFRAKHDLGDADVLSALARTQLRTRTKKCTTLCEPDEPDTNLGLIVGDPSAQTMNDAILLKSWLESNRKFKSIAICYFGPRLDEAKLLNSETINKYVFLSHCRLLNTPWLNRSFERVGRDVDLITTFEFACQLDLKEYDFEYENSGDVRIILDTKKE